MKKILKNLVIIVLLGIIITGSVMYFNLPTTRMNYISELIMLGDLDYNGKWDKSDSLLLEKYLLKPFDFSDKFSNTVDINQNNEIDEEDIFILNTLFVNPNPYEAEKLIKAKGIVFPKPRELYKYFPTNEYIKRPLFLLQTPIVNNSLLRIILDSIIIKSSAYEKQLRNEIYDEAVRFSFRYNQRINSLTQVEKDYANKKIAYCIYLYQSNDLYNLLLNIISLVEDSETLSISNQSEFIRKILYFREHIRELITSEMYKKFELGQIEHPEILNQIELYLKNDLDFIIDFSTLESPRDLTKISNYIERAEWQYYKSKTTKKSFEDLVLFAQYNRRYLRCVSKTNPKHQDIEVRNHNLPMILLFREALNIMQGDKKAAVGMLDESIRIPFAWVKSLPKENLPSSIAFENFLLPGNKEDGADKSRHWNVFGGISIYDSPEKALKLSLQREINDLKEKEYSKEAMDEFIRDLIANVNGIYYVTSINIDKIKATNKH